MDALKKAEAANKERTPPEIPVTDSVSESLKFFTKETSSLAPETADTASSPVGNEEDTLNLLDWEAESEVTLPAVDDKADFDWLNAEISLPADENPPKIPPTATAHSETSEFFIDEPEADDDFVLENFDIEDPASTPEISAELIAAASQEESQEESDVLIPATTGIKPSNSIEFTPPLIVPNPPQPEPPLVTHTQPTPETVAVNKQEAAQRIFNARQQNIHSSRKILYAVLVLVVLGIVGVYAYSFLFSSAPSAGLTRYPITHNTAPVAQNPAPTPPASPLPASPNNPTVTINNNPMALPATPPPPAPPVNNISNFQPVVPTFPPMTLPEKIEKNGNSLPNVTHEPAKIAKNLPKNASSAPEKMMTPLQGPEQLTGMLNLKKDSLTHASQDLSSAYQALQQGNLSHSERAYKKVLQYDGRNRDALLGLAAIALQQGRVAQAQHYYQQILQSYPQDSLAQAGLISSLGERSSDASVSQLKTMLAQLSQKAENLPQLAYLQFTLGNVYARQQAWTEAQQAYFEAYRTEPRADYAYNLAISLDQLQQYAAARNYYQQALQLGRGKETSGFDRQAAMQRLQELTPSSQGGTAVSPVE
jgi:Tfp pilus assembly protein PilF